MTSLETPIEPGHTICVECLTASPVNDLVKDWRETFLCTGCAELYYKPCGICLRQVASDEAKAQQNGLIACPECVKTSAEESGGHISEDQIAQLVTEYLALYAEERQLVERLETIKTRLKTAAEAKERIGGAVTLRSEGGDGGSIKCAYRTSVKCKAEEVAKLEQMLDRDVFEGLFNQKISYSADTNALGMYLDNEQIPGDLRQAISGAVELSETVTLTVVRPKP